MLIQPVKSKIASRKARTDARRQSRSASFSHLRLFANAAIAALILLTALPSLAVELYLWQVDPSLPQNILIVREGERPDQALHRYIGETQSRPYAQSLGLNQALQPGAARPQNAFEKLTDAEIAPSGRRVLMISNDGKDLKPGSRMVNWKKLWGYQGESTYLLPPGATIGLNPWERLRAHALLIKHFPFWNGMGGRDWDPSTYNEANRSSFETILEQDQLELALLKDGLRSGRIVYTGVCRGGAQALCLAMRDVNPDEPHLHPVVPHQNSILQSISREVPGSRIWHELTPEDQDFSHHEAEIHQTTQGIFKSMLAASNRITVNSSHHQAVRVDPASGLEVAASAPDGIIEALELKSGRGIVFQFHPEHMHNKTSDGIFQGLAEYKRRVLTADACSGAFAE